MLPCIAELLSWWCRCCPTCALHITARWKATIETQCLKQNQAAPSPVHCTLHPSSMSILINVICKRLGLPLGLEAPLMAPDPVTCFFECKRALPGHSYCTCHWRTTAVGSAPSLLCGTDPRPHRSPRSSHQHQHRMRCPQLLPGRSSGPTKEQHILSWLLN